MNRAEVKEEITVLYEDDRVKIERTDNDTVWLTVHIKQGSEAI